MSEPVYGSFNIPQCFEQQSSSRYARVPGCPHDGKCILKKCPNYIMCKTSDPIDLMECWGDRCLQCDMQFGLNLTFRKSDDKQECSICFNETHQFVKFPHCVHETCVRCFKTIHQIDDEPKVHLSDNGDYFWDDDELNTKTSEIHNEERDIHTEDEYAAFLVTLSPGARQNLVRAENEFTQQLQLRFPTYPPHRIRRMFWLWMVDVQRRWWEEPHETQPIKCPLCRATTRAAWDHRQ